MFRTTFHHKVITPIPHDVTPEDVTNLLHNHPFLITMSPIVTKHNEKERKDSKITYTVYENIDLLPFGWRKQEIQFDVTFEDQTDGQITWIEAPMGLTSKATYTVRPMEEGDLKHDEEGKASKWVLQESIESSCSVFFKPLVSMTMVPVRRKMHAGVIDKAREKSADGVQEELHPETPLPKYVYG